MVAVIAARRSSRFLQFVVFVTLAWTASSAHAQTQPRASLGAFGTFGTSGGLQYEGVEDTDPLASSYGGGVQFGYALHRYFSLGVIGRYVHWHAKADTQGSSFVEGLIAPRGQYPLTLGTLPLTLFLQVPVGVALVDRDYRAAYGARVDWTNSPAFVIGVSAGAELYLTRRIGVFLELGWLHHAFDVELSGKSPTGVSVRADLGYQTDQPFAQLGVIFVLSHQ